MVTVPDKEETGMDRDKKKRPHKSLLSGEYGKKTILNISIRTDLL